MPYRYETHLHTKHASLCGVASGSDYIRRYQDAGYAGIFVTDHFFHGNCAVDQTLPWKEQVDWYCRGYEEAREEGDKRGFQVFFGWEENFAGDEYLIYGLDKQWLYAHPEVKQWTRAQQHAEVRKYGGCVVRAHPFRNRAYLSDIYLGIGCMDAAEAFNASDPMEVNAQSYHFVKNLGLPMLAGSDIHNVKGWDPAVISGVELDTPLRDVKDWVERILRHEPMRLIAPVAELSAPCNQTTTLPVRIQDEQGKDMDIALEELLK